MSSMLFLLPGMMCSANDLRRSVAIVDMCVQLIEGRKQSKVGQRGKVDVWLMCITVFGS